MDMVDRDLLLISQERLFIVVAVAVMVGRQVLSLVESVEVVMVVQEVVMQEKQILEVVVVVTALAAPVPEGMVVQVSLLFAINSKVIYHNQNQNQNLKLCIRSQNQNQRQHLFT
tara:strand:- start:368 stop:709 length:342 start_codon:yes stop_codon:yes gene_type:complete